MDDDVREALMRAESLRQQLAGLESQRELLADLVQDAGRSLATLEGLATNKEGDEILVPIGAGTFVHARLMDVERAITTIGSSLHAEMALPDAKKRLEERVATLQASSQRISGDINRVVQELERLNAMLESQVPMGE